MSLPSSFHGILSASQKRPAKKFFCAGFACAKRNSWVFFPLTRPGVLDCSVVFFRMNGRSQFRNLTPKNPKLTLPSLQRL